MSAGGIVWQHDDGDGGVTSLRETLGMYELRGVSSYFDDDELTGHVGIFLTRDELLALARAALVVEGDS